MGDESNDTPECGVEEPTGSPTDPTETTPPETDALDSETVGQESDGSDARTPLLDGPDVERWATILDVREFRTSLDALDEIFRTYDYAVELHVGRPSFKQVEYDHRPKPDRLFLLIDDEYEAFTKRIRHPFFVSMDRDEFRTPKNASVVLGFGGYGETKPIPTDLEYAEIHVPTYDAYYHYVIQEFFDQYGTSDSSNG